MPDLLKRHPASPESRFLLGIKLLRRAVRVADRQLIGLTRGNLGLVEALREVNAPGSFEGQTTAGIGVTQRVGFRVLELTNPTRIVIDLAHPSQPTPPADDGAAGLVVSPSSGPVGTKVTVEGRNCNNRGSASTSTDLVFQNGQDGTVGAVGFGQIPNDSQGRFRTTVTIPARMDPLQGIGGVRPDPAPTSSPPGRRSATRPSP